MISIDERVTIDRPPEEVFEWMTQDENIELYSSNLQSYQRVAGEGVEVGAKHDVVVRVAGRKLRFTDETIEVDDGKRVVTRSEDGPIPYTLDIRVEPADGGAEVIWHQELDSYGGVFGKLADPIVTKLYTRDVRSNLEQAKILLEA
jgi:uncharacterized protein YndB with AHSA1/START domain